MSTIREVTNILLSEVAPHLDEVVAYAFAQIESVTPPAEVPAAKKSWLKKHAKALIGIAVAGGTLTAGVLNRKKIGAAGSKLLSGAKDYINQAQIKAQNKRVAKILAKPA